MQARDVLLGFRSLRRAVRAVASHSPNPRLEVELWDVTPLLSIPVLGCRTQARVFAHTSAALQKTYTATAWGFGAVRPTASGAVLEPGRPNILIILTDDQSTASS